MKTLLPYARTAIVTYITVKIEREKSKNYATKLKNVPSPDPKGICSNMLLKMSG